MKIQIKPKIKKGTQVPQTSNNQIVNIIPIVTAKNKDFLKIITKKYPESIRNWILKTYPRTKKQGLESPCKIYDIQSWREKVKKLATNVVIGIVFIIGLIFHSK